MNRKTESPIDPQGQALLDCLLGLGAKPAEAYNTVQAVRGMSADNIIHEIRTLSASVDAKTDAQNAKTDAQNAKFDAQNTKIDAQNTKIESKIDAQNAKFDAMAEAQNAKFESLRWMIGVLIGLLTLLAILGFFAFIGRAEPVSDPCTHIESAQAPLQPEPAAAEPLEPTGEAVKAPSGGRPDRPPSSGESRRAVEAQPEEDTVE